MSYMKHLHLLISELESLEDPTEDELFELRLAKLRFDTLIRNKDMANALKVWEA